VATLDVFTLIIVGSIIGTMMLFQYVAPRSNLANCRSAACRRATISDANFLDRTLQTIPTMGILFLAFLVLAAIAAR
jgi:hypothetical protein